jgi:uncharacterized caspase-like protein
MLRSAFLSLLAFLFVISADPARADKRVALVIGISNYQQVPRLANPVRDADALSALLRKAGFDIVDSERDLGIADLRRAIREFSSKARDADIAVIYYAGHGMEVDGTNYLVPADAKLSNDFDVEDEAVSLDRMLRALDPVKRLRLVILDACRDNPFSRAMKRTVASRSIGRGLAKVEPTMSNTLIAFAAKAGAVAEDGDGENSPFAAALVRYIAEPGLDLRIAFGRVRDQVLKATDNRQEPFVYGSLGGDTVALVPQSAKPADAEAQARIDYELAAQIGTKEAWDSFLESHPTGLYANLARAQNSKLLAAQLSHAKADDARRDAEDKAAQKAEELRKQLDETNTRQTAGVRQKLEQTKKELEEAKKQAELAQQQAEAARQEVAEAKRQAAAEAQRQVEEAKRAEKEVGKQTVKETASDPSKANAGTVATLAPNETHPQPSRSSSSLIDQADLTRLLQAHLKRVGCNSGNVDGKWDDSSKKALELFNKHAETKFDVKVASLDALDAVRSRSDRVCPLICAKGQRAEGDRCVQIGCESGYFLNSSGACEKRHEPAARPRVVIRGRPALPPQSGSSGGCGLDSSGHRDTGGFRCRD